MGFFDFFTNLFSKSDKTPSPKGRKKTTSKKIVTKKKPAAKKAAAQKKKQKTATKPSKEGQVAVKKKKKRPADAPSDKKRATAKKAGPKKKKKAAKPKQEKPTKLPFSFGGKASRRKKSEQVKSDPIDKDALGFSISLKAENGNAKKRNAVRIQVRGLAVHIPRLNKKFKVTDISATGLGFAFEKPRMKSGVKLKMDIYLKDECKAKTVECEVKRHAGKSVGCAFVELDRAQDDAVHEIVLIGQKQQTARKNAMKDLEFKLPE